MKAKTTHQTVINPRPPPPTKQFWKTMLHSCIIKCKAETAFSSHLWKVLNFHSHTWLAVNRKTCSLLPRQVPQPIPPLKVKARMSLLLKTTDSKIPTKTHTRRPELNETSYVLCRVLHLPKTSKDCIGLYFYIQIFQSIILKREGVRWKNISFLKFVRETL